MNMPKGMQILKLKDELRRARIASDTVDLHALVDSTLSYPENERLIMSRFKRTDPKTKKSHKGGTLGGVGSVDMHHASQYHQSRSPRARSTDEARRNKNTHTEKQLDKKPALLDSWFRRPGNSDIYGIDGFGGRPGKKKR